jgi:hypothetical protein
LPRHSSHCAYRLVGGHTPTTPGAPTHAAPPERATAIESAGAISGIVFLDHNADGVMNIAASDTSPQIDQPIAAVTVTAYDALGASAGAATSGADGAYALSASGDGPYRIEFSSLPAGLVFDRRAVPSNAAGGGARANAAGSSVQFGASAGPSLHGPNYRSDWKVDGALNSWDAAGKTSLGDIDLSDDGRTLYAVNLFDRNLYFIDTDSAAVVRTVDMPLDLAGAAQKCARDQVRPYGLGVKDGVLYAGLVCAGPNPADLRAYVYSFDGTAFNSASHVEYSLNYPRGCADKGG